jgi:hypothetical protein
MAHGKTIGREHLVHGLALLILFPLLIGEYQPGIRL